MLREVTGDILESRAEAIAHGIAPDDDFHRGLALSLRERWPSMYRDFRHYCRTTSPKPGDAWAWKGAGGAWIISLFTQEPPGHDGGRPGKASISHVAHALKSLAKELEDKGVKSVALPRLATGVGGLDWEQVRSEIDKAFAKSDLDVYLYTSYRKGERAAES
jgi:O-acetyl-ADP-ribose deacetylase (regulator of RNase III)